MKPRSLVLLAILLILILVGLSWFRRNVVSKIDEQIQYAPKTGQVETIEDGERKLIESITVSNAGQNFDDEMNWASSHLVPIQFEHFSFSGLEEVAVIAAKGGYA